MVVVVVPSVVSRSITFSKDTRHLGTHMAQRLTRELCVIFESCRVSSSCAGQDSVMSVSLLWVCRMVRYLTTPTSPHPSLSLSLSRGLEQPAIITMYGSEVCSTIFGKAHTQNAQESESVLRERMVLLLTTTACPCEKILLSVLLVNSLVTTTITISFQLFTITREKVRWNEFPPEEEEEEEKQIMMDTNPLPTSSWEFRKRRFGN